MSSINVRQAVRGVCATPVKYLDVQDDDDARGVCFIRRLEIKCPVIVVWTSASLARGYPDRALCLRTSLTSDRLVTSSRH